jgi:uncharacterized repeat protein (TIGR03806 family)
MRLLAIIFALAALCTACGTGTRSVTFHPADAIPEKLSDWGVVAADGAYFELGSGVVPYDINTPLFSDYALKLRAVWLPPGNRAVYNARQELDFPVGTILVKTFHYEKADGFGPASLRVLRADRESDLGADKRLDLGDYVLIETRLLVHYASGWKGLAYVWNAAQDEAYLAPAGDDRAITLVAAGGAQSIHYMVPDANQCAGCHTPDHGAKALRPLGPKAWQLNRPYAWWGDDGGQLEHWRASGMLEGFDGEPPSGPRWANRAAESPDRLARAYLDANCAHCHNPRGAADTSALDLSLAAPAGRHLGICKPPVAVGRGSGGRRYDIFPGRPDESIIVYRMEHSAPDIAMPELGRSAVHAEGVAAVRHWIAGMNGSC